MNAFADGLIQVVHVLDARDPLGTRCRSIEEYIRKEAPHKHLVFVLNKTDLVPTGVAVGAVSMMLSFDLVTLLSIVKSRLVPAPLCLLCGSLLCYNFGILIPFPPHLVFGLVCRLLTVLESTSKGLGYASFELKAFSAHQWQIGEGLLSNFSYIYTSQYASINLCTMLCRKNLC